MNKKTIVIGASANPSRYAYMAVQLLKQNKCDVVALGLKPGQIDGIMIDTSRPMLKDVHTIALYIGADKQKDWYSYILSVHPRRLIFNPGTENEELYRLALAHGIAAEEACTLTLLHTGQY